MNKQKTSCRTFFFSGKCSRKHSHILHKSLAPTSQPGNDPWSSKWEGWCLTTETSVDLMNSAKHFIACVTWIFDELCSDIFHTFSSLPTQVSHVTLHSDPLTSSCNEPHLLTICFRKLYDDYGFDPVEHITEEYLRWRIRYNLERSNKWPSWRPTICTLWDPWTMRGFRV